ncbi:MAG: hypothetical protein QG585_186 [Patescibacteria group bacterium]|jgi:hypothetical protein|nr:hypothetical protein [Patescibacteria group bacterium]
MEKEKIIWPSYEYDFREKSRDWFWAVGITALSIAAISLLFANIFFAIFIILAGTTIMITANRPPKIIDFEISDKGIRIDEVVYPYTELHSFWVEDNKFSVPKLLVRSERLIAHILVIPIETDVVNAKDVREYIGQFLPEETLYEPLSKRVMESLGF